MTHDWGCRDEWYTKPKHMIPLMSLWYEQGATKNSKTMPGVTVRLWSFYSKHISLWFMVVFIHKNQDKCCIHAFLHPAPGTERESSWWSPCNDAWFSFEHQLFPSLIWGLVATLLPPKELKVKIFGSSHLNILFSERGARVSVGTCMR